MTDGDEDSRRSPGRRGKVLRLVEEYGLDGIGAELERSWTAEGSERRSLRELADYFNRQLLAEAMTEAGMQPRPDSVERTYEHLTDETTEADRIRTRRQLEREGVDVEDVRDDFLTYQAVRTYLTEHRNVEYEGNDRPRIDVERENVQRLRGRTAAVSESKLEQLRNADDVSIGSFQTSVDVNVLCEDCGGRFEFDELLDRGRCRCDDDGTT